MYIVHQGGTRNHGRDYPERHDLAAWVKLSVKFIVEKGENKGKRENQIIKILVLITLNSLFTVALGKN